MSFTRGFHPRRRQKPGRDRLQRARVCQRGRTWDDLRASPAAQALGVPEDVIESFEAQHWQSLPRVIRPGQSHESILRLGREPVLSLFTFCAEGKIKGLLCTHAERGNFAEELV